MAERDGSHSAAGTRSRRRLQARRLLIVLAVTGVALALTRIGFDLWRHMIVPDDAPRIAMYFPDSPLLDIGITKATYEQALARAGGHLVELDEAPDRLPDGEWIRSLLAGADGLLLTGGGDVDPELYGGEPATAEDVSRARDDYEIALIREARRRSLPILGICRGCQILNVAHGGTLRNLRVDKTLRTTHFRFSGHAVQLEPESVLANVLGTTRLERVESFHGQAVERPGTGVRVAARAEDGVIEAIEIEVSSRAGWIVGVQWHPELTVRDEKQEALLEAFVAAARRHPPDE